jgi:hypothetical protein
VDASLCPVEAICASGHWPHRARFCALGGGLTEQRGWVVQGDHLSAHACAGAVSALPVGMDLQAPGSPRWVIPISNRGARKSQSWARVVCGVQLSYHLHDLCAVAEDPAALFDYGQVVAHEGELPHRMQ